VSDVEFNVVEEDEWMAVLQALQENEPEAVEDDDSEVESEEE
jgi:hypothetical protein